MSAVEVHRVVKKGSRDEAPGARRTPRLLVRPLTAPEDPIDVTTAITRAIAHALWQRDGGNEVLNWLEAERVVADMLARLYGAGAGLTKPGRSSAIELKPAGSTDQSKPKPTGELLAAA